VTPSPVIEKMNEVSVSRHGARPASLRTPSLLLLLLLLDACIIRAQYDGAGREKFEQVTEVRNSHVIGISSS